MPAVVLRNQGVPMRLAQLNEDGRPIVTVDPETGDETGIAERKVFLRFDANVISQIEERWDGVNANVWVDEADREVDDDERDAAAKEAEEKDRKPREFRRVTRTFYGVDGFRHALADRPTGTCRDVIALALGMEPEAVGAAMLPGENNAYQAAVGVAWSLAQGVDPTTAARLLDQANAAVAANLAEINKTLTADLADTPGTSGSEPGSPTEEPSTSSGD